MEKRTVLFAVVLGVFVSLACAGQNRAQKVKIDGMTWDTENQQFVLALSCKFGIATAAEHASFTTRTTLRIPVGEEQPCTVQAAGEIAKQEGADKDGAGYIKIEPLAIPWDRGGGNFEGDAHVAVTIGLVGPGGKTVGRTVTETRLVEDIVGPGGPVTHTAR